MPGLRQGNFRTTRNNLEIFDMLSLVNAVVLAAPACIPFFDFSYEAHPQIIGS